MSPQCYKDDSSSTTIIVKHIRHWNHLPYHLYVLVLHFFLLLVPGRVPKVYVLVMTCIAIDKIGEQNIPKPYAR